MHARRRILTAILPLLLAAAAVGAAQSDQAAKAASQQDQAAKASTPAPALSGLFPGLEFRNVGPFRGGRVTAVAGLRGERLVYFFGATGGGLWRTTDAGATWKPLAAAALVRHKELQRQLKELLGRLDTALTQDLGARSKAVADAGIPPVIVVPGDKRRRDNPE